MVSPSPLKLPCGLVGLFSQSPLKLPYGLVGLFSPSPLTLPYGLVGLFSPSPLKLPCGLVGLFRRSGLPVEFVPGLHNWSPVPTLVLLHVALGPRDPGPVVPVRFRRRGDGAADPLPRVGPRQFKEK